MVSFYGLCCLAACQTSTERHTSQSEVPQHTSKPDSAKAAGDRVISVRDSVIDWEEDWQVTGDWDELPSEAPLHFETRPTSKTIVWDSVGTGLSYALIAAPLISSVGDSEIDVLRIDPEKVTLTLLSARWDGKGKRTAADWASQSGALALINAGMFDLTDGLTNTGYMRSGQHINNATINTTYNLVAAFGPKEPGLPDFRFIDLRCVRWEDWRDKYESYVQGIRIVDCNRKNRWSKQEKFWSMALLGSDSQGHLLFIFCRSPYRVHDMANMLLELPIDLQQLMYLEGGPEASFYLGTPLKQLAKAGSYETDFWPDDSNDRLWAIPNLIAVLKKD